MPTTRSASVEPIPRRGTRTTRQSSVESVDSNVSVASNTRGGRRKKATRAVVSHPELSVVDEDPDNDEGEVEVNERASRLPQSPGALSQMSGTTAQTSHTTAELAGLDPTMVVELLPDLWTSSLRLLEPLAPPNVSMDFVMSTVKELKVPGSAGAKRFAHREEKFGLDRAKFGNDDYIRPRFILQKVFGTQEVGAANLQPDAILQAANLATLIKELLVKEKEGLSTWNFMSNLDTWFPESFVSSFDDNVYVGNSTLIDESFKMALEIRTQYTVVALLYHKAGEEEWHPDEVLVGLFLDPPDEPSPELSKYEDYTSNGYVKSLMRAGPPNTAQQQAMIWERVNAIRDAFRQSEDAVQAGDLVDFDQLEEQFPWSEFLVKLVQWTSTRLDEIKESVREQGGVDNLAKGLVDTLTSMNSQADLHFEPHPSTATPRQLLPAPEIVPGTTGHSLLSKSAVRKVEAMKRSISGSSNHAQQKATSSAGLAASNRNARKEKANLSRTHATRPAEPEEPEEVSDGFNPMPEDDDNPVGVPGTRKTSDYVRRWESHDREKNKENRHPTGREPKNPAKRFIDEQPNARRLEWGSQDSGQSRQNHADSSSHKRAHEEFDSDSEDAGFQDDQREIDPSRRPNRRVSPDPPMRTSPKRPRTREEQRVAPAARESRQQQQQQQRQEAALQASARAAAEEDEYSLEQDEHAEDVFEENPPRPTATQVSIVAREEAAIRRSRMAMMQTRRKWSDQDTELFVELIGQFGCSWSLIAKTANFEDDRDQVALKDKARNLKVTYLRADIPLPLNFDKVALGQKEIRSVQAVRPDWEP